MAKIQIEYTANVENLKTKLNELVKINETLSRSVFATKMALEDMSKATSQSTTKKALEDIKKASDGVSKSAETAANSLKKAANTPPPRSNYKNWAKETESIIKQLFSNVLEYEKNADARRQKFANDDVNRRRKTAKDVEKYDQETKRLWLAHLAEMDRAAAESQKQRLKLGEERVKAKQREVEAKKKADAEYVKWWEKELSKLEKEEAKKAQQSVQTAERAAREKAASEARASKQREAEQKRLTRETEREERRRVVATQKAEAERVKASQKAEADRGKASQSSTQSMMKPLMALRGYVAAAFAVSSIVSFGEEIIKLLAKLELLESRLGFIYGGTGAGNAAFLRLSSSIKELGLEYEETLEQATSFSIAAQQAGYTTTQVEKMFISFASSLRAAGSSSLQVQRSFYALQQMMSKGVVSAEELNRQMGESLPGAAMLMFKAYKNLHPELVQNFEDFRKLQKEGKILSAEVLPEFIKVLEEEFGPALEGKKNSLSARLNRLSQAYAEFKASLLDTAPIKNATSVLENMLNKMTALMSSERLSFFEKLLAFSGGPSAEFIQLKAEVEANLKLKDANYMQTKVQEKNLAHSKLTKEEQQERYNNLEKEIKAYKTYLELISKTPQGADFLDRYATSSPQVATNLQRPETMAGFDLRKRGYRDISKAELSVAEQILRDLSVMISAEGAPTGDDATKEGKTLRELALESEINRVKELIAIEKTAIEVFNHNSGIKFDTTKNLMELNIELITLEEEIKNLRQKGSQEDLNAAERNLEIVKENIKFMEEEQKLLLYQMELEKNLIEERLANATTGSIEEYRIREELMIKTADIEKKKVQNNAEAVKKITAQTNAEIKKMYDDLEKRIKEFLSDTEEMIAAPFRTKREQEIADINKKFDQQIQAVTEQYQLGTLFPDQRRKGRTPEEGLSNVLKYIDLLDRLNKSRKKALSEGEEGENILGLSDEDLQKLQKALQVAIDLFQDYYDARTEIAKNAIEKEQALLDKKFEAGLIRENEYNEETKKNKEEMAKLDRDAARFGVLINTAQAIVKLYTDFDAITATILAAGVVAVGATQLSAINSAPLPEFHEGGLDIKKNDNKKPNRGLKSGEFYAKLLEGESVMTREETAKYKDVLKAIREDSLPSHIMKGYTAPAYHRSMDEPYRMAKEQTSLELAFQNAELVDAIRRNGAVAIKNPDEIADAIVSKSSYTKITNRRRIR